jgi:hypothetical protein
MVICSRCRKELREGEEFGVIRIQLWKIKVGDKECKNPDEDETRNYCSECSRVAPLDIWKH